MKVLMLTQYPFSAEDERLGGIMQASYRLVAAIDSLQVRSLRLFVLTQSAQVTRRTERRLPNGTTVVYFPSSTTKWDLLLFGYPSVFRALRQTIRDLSPDLIHGQGTAKYIYASTHSGLPHLVTLHGIYRNELKVVKSQLTLTDRITRVTKVLLERHYISGIRNLIAITNEVAAFVQSASPNCRIFRIENPIDEAFFSIGQMADHAEPVILFVAAITYRKGLDFLLESFERVLKYESRAILRIAGIWDWDPHYVASLQQQYRELIDAGNICFLGGITQQKLIEEMANAYLLCLPSRAESAPMVISQAMAAARPVVASRVGGIPDMIEDHKTGKLWAVGNTQSLSEIINATLADLEGSRAMGNSARLVALERYSSEAVAKKTVDAYAHVVNDRDDTACRRS